MSLVAYESSGEESASSDSEEIQCSSVSKELITSNDGPEDEEEPYCTSEGRDLVHKTGLVSPWPKQSNEISNCVSGKTSLSLSSVLPKPKNTNNVERKSTDKQGISVDEKAAVSLETTMDSEEILEIEEEYEPISKRTKMIPSEVKDKPKSVGSLFSLLPSPWQTENTWVKGANPKVKRQSKQNALEEKGSKQHIKIAIPTAPKTDSDDEDDIPAPKKLAPSKEGSGLKSLLPKPKHSITMIADNPNKPSVKLASRPLIPHTLTKRAVSATEKKPQKTAKKSSQVEDAISDDDEEPVSFFTFSDKTESLADETLDNLQNQGVKNRAEVKQVEISNPFPSPFPQGEIPSTSVTSQSSEEHLTESVSLQPVTEKTSQVKYGSGENFSSAELETKTYYYEQQPAQYQQYQGYSASDYQTYSYDTGYYGQESEAYTYTYPTGTPTQQQTQQKETNIDLEKLQKLKGKRNRHEEIHIVDVNADDQIGNSAEILAKYGTEEEVYRPSRKKKDMPTAQQRRKHQITYLAFQAKERELELRQQWSTNRQTRRQTQSKYGF